MRDYLNIGPSPPAEDCAQVGSEHYDPFSSIECRAYVYQLRRVFGDEPGSARLAVKCFPHDYGTYKEVVVTYDENDEEGLDYALKLEGDGPVNWDDLARIYIKTEKALYLAMVGVGIKP